MLLGLGFRDVQSEPIGQQSESRPHISVGYHIMIATHVFEKPFWIVQADVQDQTLTGVALDNFAARHVKLIT